MFAGVPGPSPWYLLGDGPQLPGFEWLSAGDTTSTTGAVVLSGPAGPILALDFQNYVYPLSEGVILVWHQRHIPDGPTHPVLLRTFHYKEMVPLLGPIEEVCSDMRKRKASFAAAGCSNSELATPTVLVNEDRSMAFPVELQSVEELLILCHSSGIEEHTSSERNNVALLIAQPRVGWYRLYSQDWFNSAGLDFGYQWVTRVMRDPRTGSINGEGIRINSFVLDQSMRNTL